MSLANVKPILLLLLGTLIYYYLARFDMWLFSFHPSNIALLWLPFGVGVILIQHFGLRALPFIYIASFIANHDGMAGTQGYLLYLSITAFADTIAPFLSSLLISRYVKGKFNTIGTLLPFTLYGTLLPTFVSAVIISVDLAWGGYISNDKIYEYILWLMWSDGLGLLLIYPLYEQYKISSFPSKREWKSIVIYALLSISVVWIAFYFHYLLFLLFPLLLYAAYQLKTNAIMTIVLFCVIGIIALSAHFGTFFPSDSPIDSMLMLITYLISLVFVIIGTSLHNSELTSSKLLVNTDNLTQIKNVKAYREKIYEMFALFKRYHTPFCILMLDIDNFKRINDTYGHRVGDIVLIELAALLERQTRDVDNVFRVGGEEFVIILPNTKIDNANEAAEKIRACVESDLNVISNQIITISIGVSEVYNTDTEDTLYRRADSLLYQSKQNGKNTVSY